MTTSTMEKNKKQEILISLSNGTERLVDIAPLKALFENDPNLQFIELADDLQSAKDIMVQNLSPDDAGSMITIIKNKHLSLTFLINVFAKMTWREVRNENV